MLEMYFRDGVEILKEGEVIVVLKGVEYCLKI